METGLLHLHSFLRWVIILLALITIANSLRGMLLKKHFRSRHQRTALFLLISCDIQLLLGITIFFVNGWWNAVTEGQDTMTDPVKRFFTLEHTVGMIIGITLIHIGYASAKKALHSEPKFKRLFWYTLAAMVVILASVPWPFRHNLGMHTWFPGMN